MEKVKGQDVVLRPDLNTIFCLKRRKVGEQMGCPVRRRRKKLSRFTVFGVIVLCIVLCSTLLYKNMVLQAKSTEYAQQIEELEKEQAKLNDEKKEIKEYQSYVKTDEYVEDTAREKLGLVYPDEIIFEPED